MLKCVIFEIQIQIQMFFICIISKFKAVFLLICVKMANFILISKNIYINKTIHKMYKISKQFTLQSLSIVKRLVI